MSDKIIPYNSNEEYDKDFILDNLINNLPKIIDIKEYCDNKDKIYFYKNNINEDKIEYIKVDYNPELEYKNEEERNKFIEEIKNNKIYTLINKEHNKCSIINKKEIYEFRLSEKNNLIVNGKEYKEEDRFKEAIIQNTVYSNSTYEILFRNSKVKYEEYEKLWKLLHHNIIEVIKCKLIWDIKNKKIFDGFEYKISEYLFIPFNIYKKLIWDLVRENNYTVKINKRLKFENFDKLKEKLNKEWIAKYNHPWDNVNTNEQTVYKQGQYQGVNINFDTKELDKELNLKEDRRRKKYKEFFEKIEQINE